MKTIAVVIIIIGFVLTVFTSKDVFNKPIEEGNTRIIKTPNTENAWQPIAGVALMGLGLIGLLADYTDRKSRDT